jgi:hypothetical protein
MGCWLRENGLGDVTPAERYKLLRILENLAAISQWRDTLPDKMRRKLNHPGAIWSHWRKAAMAKENCAVSAGFAEHPQRLHIVTSGKRRKGGPPNRPSQDMVRHLWAAMRESGSGDYLVLAGVAAQAALDFLDLIHEPAPTRAPANPAPVAAMALL